MKHKNKNEKGLTLIEVMVTLVIATIFGFIVFSVFLIYNNTSRISISFFLLQQEYENITHQIAQDVRKASFVLAIPETPRLRGGGYDTVNSIMLWEAASPFTQYTIKSGNLLEGTKQTTYKAGGGPVTLCSDKSYFILDPQRKKVKIYLSLNRIYLGKTYSLSPRGELIVCRN